MWISAKNFFFNSSSLGAVPGKVLESSTESYSVLEKNTPSGSAGSTLRDQWRRGRISSQFEKKTWQKVSSSVDGTEGRVITTLGPVVPIWCWFRVRQPCFRCSLIGWHEVFLCHLSLGLCTLPITFLSCCKLRVSDQNSATTHGVDPNINSRSAKIRRCSHTEQYNSDADSHLCSQCSLILAQKALDLSIFALAPCTISFTTSWAWDRMFFDSDAWSRNRVWQHHEGNQFLRHRNRWYHSRFLVTTAVAGNCWNHTLGLFKKEFAFGFGFRTLGKIESCFWENQCGIFETGSNQGKGKVNCKLMCLGPGTLYQVYFWPNPHWTRARTFVRKSFDVAWMQCEHSHLPARLVWMRPFLW